MAVNDFPYAIARLDNHGAWMQTELEYRLCCGLRVVLRKTETVSARPVAAASTKGWDAFVRQMRTILFVESEVALFIGQYFSQLASNARGTARDTQRTEAVHDELTACRAALIAERQELTRQKLVLFEVV